MPAFSVVIPTRNRAAALPLAVDSVLNQDLDDLEVVVVDDGSTDDSSRVMQSFTDPRVRRVRQKHGGPSLARNTGVECSSGRFVAFLDDDDHVLPSWLGLLDRTLGGDAAVASCGQVLVDPSGVPTRTRRPRPLGPVFDDHVALIEGATYAVTREAFDAAGGFTEGLHSSTHTELALRLLPLCSARSWAVRWTDQVLVRHLDRPPAERFRNAPDNLLAACTYILDRHGDRLSRSPAMLADYCAVGGVAAARLGDYRAARQLFARAVRTAPRVWRHHLRFLAALAPPVGDRVWDVHLYRGQR
jgi:glycosyltransferase involved in cell wall biosynthesis